MISWMANAQEGDSLAFGPITFGPRVLTGPNGLTIHYHDLTYEVETREWTYDYGGRIYKLFGGKVLENVIQFLARIATMQAALRVKKRAQNLTVHFAHQAHDELVYLCRNAELAVILTEEMSRRLWALCVCCAVNQDRT